MNFFYRLPILTFSHFLLSSAQYSGDNTCNFRKICQNRHLNEFPNFLQDGVSSKLPAYSVFIDIFTEKKTLLPNLDYISCLVNECDNHNLVARFLFKRNRIEKPQKHSAPNLMFEVLRLMNIVMTKKQRERFEISLKKMPHMVNYAKMNKQAQKILHPLSEILDGWTEQSVTRDKSTFNNQNVRLNNVVVEIMRKQIGDYYNLASFDNENRRSFIKKFEKMCPYLNRKARRQIPREQELMDRDLMKDLMDDFKVDYENCYEESETCTLGNRIKVFVANYIFENSLQLNGIFYREVYEKVC